MNIDSNERSSSASSRATSSIKFETAFREPHHGNQSGYPCFTDFICQPENMLFRRFRYMRMRMLLRLQFKITSLENELQKLDQMDEENDPMPLISQKDDSNEERERVFTDLKDTLAEYDDLMKRIQWILQAPEPTSKHLRNVRSRVEECLAETDCDYVNKDVINIGYAADPKFGRLYQWSENMTISAVVHGVKIGERLGWIDDPAGMVISGTVFRMVTRTIAAFFSVVILLLPMVVLNFVDASGWRLGVVFIFATLFIAALTTLSAAGTMEIFVAGATYCAVLVVFVSQGGAGGS
ncbi:hypothetical protein IWZ00DRAFT_137934 [Phyllosticta capitalensis]